MVRLFLKLFRLLNADVSPSQLSAGLVLGMIMGLTPLMSLHNVLVLLLICVLRVNFSAALFGLLVFSAVAYLFDPFFISLGESVLTAPSLRETFTQMYQSDAWRLLHFNNTLTIGSMIVSLVLMLPSFFIFRLLIIRYREHFLAWINKLNIVQALKGTRIFQRLAKLYQLAEVDV